VLISGFAIGSGDVNCYLVAARPGAAAVVIDPGDEAVPTLEYYFDVNGFVPAAVLLTHGHATHAASTFELCAGWDIPVYIHPADRPLLADLDHGEPDAVIELHGGDELSIADILVTVDHTPGHTAGSVVYRVIADTDEGPVTVAFTGDTRLENLMVLDDDTVVLPGHGPSTSIGAARRSNPNLQEN
jgi:hydroxyacylglutathione hydrolase